MSEGRAYYCMCACFIMKRLNNVLMFTCLFLIYKRCLFTYLKYHRPLGLLFVCFFIIIFVVRNAARREISGKKIKKNK